MHFIAGALQRNRSITSLDLSANQVYEEVSAFLFMVYEADTFTAYSWYSRLLQGAVSTYRTAVNNAMCATFLPILEDKENFQHAFPFNGTRLQRLTAIADEVRVAGR